MYWIRSILFNVIFIGWTILLLATLWIILPFPRLIFRRAIAFWPKLIFPLMRVILGLDFEQRGLNNLPSGPVIFAVKHQSTWDTMFFLWLDKNNSYIMKEELNKIPFWKSYMTKAGHIVVDRKGGLATMRQMIKDTKNVLQEGRSVVIFPEGTRTQPGKSEVYHPGVAALYGQTKVPIIPVALNSGIYWGRREFRKSAGKIIIEFLKPMEKGLKKTEFVSELKSIVEAATRKLEDEAREN